jgi:ribosomal protein S18 acetylase RimI-like enzyme
MPERTPKVAYRRMTPADVQVTAYIRKAALEGLARQQGRDTIGWMPSLAPHFEHILATDPDGSWLAEIDGLAVGYAQAIVRGDIWFLCQLFVQPEVHTKGIGQELLRRAMAYGAEHGTRVYSVVSSTSPVAQSLYMRAGMFARAVGYRLSGPVAPLCELALPDGSTAKHIVECDGWRERIDRLDRAVFGAERPADHDLYRTWGGRVEAGSFALLRGHDFAGYAYTEEGGWIGPMAAYDPADQLPLLGLCARWLRDHDIENGEAWVVSHNATLMRALLDAGWRVSTWTFLKANAPFGQFDRYHPSGALLL